MTAIQQATEKKRAPSVLVSRSQLFSFDLSYYTAPLETVYENLWERLRHNYANEAPNNARLITSVWGDPSDEGNQWLLESAALDSNHPNSYAGKDKKFSWVRLPQEAIDHLHKHGFLA